MHAHPFTIHSWSEVIGYLYGFTDSNGITSITDIDQLTVGHTVSAEISADDVTFLSHVEKNEFIVGWIHSHPSFGLFLSATDIATQKVFQNLFADSIALVLDPTLITPSFSGLKAFYVDDKVREVELTIKSPKKNVNYFTNKKRILNLLQPVSKIASYQFEDVTLSLEAIDGDQELLALRSIVSDTNIPLEISYSVEVNGGELLSPLFSKEIIQKTTGGQTLAIFRVKSQVSQQCHLKIKACTCNYAGKITKHKKVCLDYRW